MHEILIANLNSRMDALKRALDSDADSYAYAVVEYIGILSNDRQVAKTFEKVVLAEYTSPTTVEHIYFFAMLQNMMRIVHGKKIRPPLFLTEAIEKEFKLHEKFLVFIDQEQKRLNIAEKEGISMSEITLPEDEHAKRLLTRKSLMAYTLFTTGSWLNYKNP